jgi:hypothetical protein
MVSMPEWFKRASPLFPVNTHNEGDLIVYDGKLILAEFNRSPLAQEVRFYDLSDGWNAVHLATRPWSAAMGGLCLDTNGGLHVYGSSPPAQNTSPFNSIIHCSVDSSFNFSPPNTILGPSGMGFNNLAVAKTPLGYVMRLEQAYPNGLKAASCILSQTPDFASYTVLGALYNNQVDFTGKSRIRSMPDGWTYVTSDAVGHTRLARTQNFTTWKFATSSFSFLGPDFGDAFPGTVGGQSFYNGNVTWEEWPIDGVPHVIAVYFHGNETTEGRVMLAKYKGTLADLFAEFTYQP